MILVTLGTQDKPFNRLLEAIQKQIDKGNIKERVVVQAGSTVFESKDMEIYSLLPMNEFDELIHNCDILITHGGEGCIITALKEGKKVIAAARLAQYGEHTNDHQTQIIGEFEKSGHIIALKDFDKLDEALEKVKTLKPKKFISNTNNMIELVRDLINNDCNVNQTNIKE